jgi:hypothetical protein
MASQLHYTRTQVLSGMALRGRMGPAAVSGWIDPGGNGEAPRSAIWVGRCEPRPETTGLRLVRKPGICVAREFVAEALLQGEGLTDVQYVNHERLADKYTALSSGEVDPTLYCSRPFLLRSVSLCIGAKEALARFEADQVAPEFMKLWS